MRAAVTVASRFRFYLSLSIVVVLVGAVGVFIQSTEPDSVEMRESVLWVRVSGLALALPPRIGVSSGQAASVEPTRLAVDPEVLPYVLSISLNDRQIWERKGNQDALSSLAFGRLPIGRLCDEISVYLFTKADSRDTGRVTVAMVPDESRHAQESEDVCLLDLTFASTGRERVSGKGRVVIELKVPNGELSLLRELTGKGLEVEFADAPISGEKDRPFKGRKVALSSSQLVLHRLGLWGSGPLRGALSLEATVCKPDDVRRIGGSAQMKTMRRWGLRLIAPVLVAIATALGLFLTILHARGEQTETLSRGPRSARRWKLATLGFVILLVALALGGLAMALWQAVGVPC